jgi:hypothetical protein
MVRAALPYTGRCHCRAAPPRLNRKHGSADRARLTRQRRRAVLRKDRRRKSLRTGDQLLCGASLAVATTIARRRSRYHVKSETRETRMPEECAQE